MSEGLEVLPIHGIGDVRPGMDLVAAIAAAAPWLRDGDVLVVTSKIISKSEGRLVDVPTSGPQREAAREEHLAAETARPVARRGHTRIVQTHHGFVMASAGIDASNVDRSQLVLLPKDPDASARALRAGLLERHGLNVAVIVSDTMGRPWRNGLVDVALGAAGLDALRDHRGEVDPYGNELHLTQMAVADELSAAAELVKGKCDQVPVAVVRGLAVTRPTDGAGAAVLIRSAEQDLFSLGTAEARRLGLRQAAQLTDAPAFGLTPTAVPVAEIVARCPAPGAVELTPVPVDSPALPPGTTLALRCAAASAARVGDHVAFGSWLHSVRCALAAEQLATIWLPSSDPSDTSERGEPGDYGTLAVGAPPVPLTGRTSA